MKNVGWIWVIGFLGLAAGCCSISQQWGYMEGYENIAFVGNEPPRVFSSTAPRDGEYSLWRLSGSRNVAYCKYRTGPDHLITAEFLRNGEPLGLRKSAEGVQAFAGPKTVLLPEKTYIWRYTQTEEDRKRIARDEFLGGVWTATGIVLEILSGITVE